MSSPVTIRSITAALLLPPATTPTGLERGIRGLRIGFIRHFHEEDMPADPAVTAALEHVAGSLKQRGAEIRDVRLPTVGEFAGVNRVILQSEAWAIHGQWLRERPGEYGQLARRRLMAGAFMSAGDYGRDRQPTGSADQWE
jgi:aspartyl-tRNA(Asn)/glutamyl-tRNA(Gln) amidotransferase subunit A